MYFAVAHLSWRPVLTAGCAPTAPSWLTSPTSGSLVDVIGSVPVTDRFRGGVAGGSVADRLGSDEDRGLPETVAAVDGSDAGKLLTRTHHRLARHANAPPGGDHGEYHRLTAHGLERPKATGPRLASTSKMHELCKAPKGGVDRLGVVGSSCRSGRR